MEKVRRKGRVSSFGVAEAFQEDRCDWNSELEEER